MKPPGEENPGGTPWWRSTLPVLGLGLAALYAVYRHVSRRLD